MMKVKDLLASGDLVGAARQEADACVADGYDVTAELLRRLATAVEVKTQDQTLITVFPQPDVKPYSINVFKPITPEDIERARNLHGELVDQLGKELSKRPTPEEEQAEIEWEAQWGDNGRGGSRDL